MSKPALSAEYPGPNAHDLKSHPGPKMSNDEVKSRDQEWQDIGSGMMSRVFKDARKLITTTKSGPPISDIQHRRVWSLTTGKVIDDADIEDTPDHVLNRALSKPDTIRVEITLKGALRLFERKGPDVAEIFSQPRICQKGPHSSPGGV